MPYVLRGLFYFLRHGSLWPMTVCPMFLALLFGVVSLLTVLRLTLFRQHNWLMGVGVPSQPSWMLATVFCMVEVLLFTLIFAKLALSKFLDALFDRVMERRGVQLPEKKLSDHVGCGCNTVSILKIASTLLTFPLNFVPLVGTMAWFLINGTLHGWDSHVRYFEHLGWSFTEQKEFVKKRWCDYVWFGTQALALELIPGFGVVFGFTNVVGAALWAAKIEEKDGFIASSKAQPLGKNKFVTGV